MRATKLRCGAEDSFTPMGAYFEKLAGQLRDANAIAAARQDALDAEDRRLEARYRRRNATPAPGLHAAL